MSFTETEKTRGGTSLCKMETKRPITFETLIEHQMETSSRQLDKYRAQGEDLGCGEEFGIYQHVCGT